MKKKLLAAAVTAALGAAPAAQADTANVNVYGKFYPAYVTYSGGEATDGKVATSTPNSNGGGVANKNAIESFNSYVGFRANLDIGGGMKAIMQVEQSVELAGDESDAHWANRNSAAGLEGGFGTVLLGRWDTPFKELHFQSAMFGVSSGSPVSNSNLLSRTPYSDGSSRASFHRRQDNSIQYWSPDFNGIQAKIMYGTEEAEDQANPRDPTRISGSLVYDKGPLLVGVAYEIHDDFRGATAGLGGALASGVDTSKDTGIGFTVAYKIGKTTTIGFDYEILKYENHQGDPGAVRDYKRNGWSLAVEQKIGQWTLAANYASAEKGDCSLFGGGACSTSGLEGKQMSFGAKYDLAKNFSIYGWWTKIDNGNSASHSFLDDAPTGADPTAWAVGLLTRF